MLPYAALLCSAVSQVAAQEGAERLEGSRAAREEAAAAARGLRAEQETLDAETASVVAQYEALVQLADQPGQGGEQGGAEAETDKAAPALGGSSSASFATPEAGAGAGGRADGDGDGDVYYTPEGSRYREAPPAPLFQAQSLFQTQTPAPTPPYAAVLAASEQVLSGQLSSAHTQQLLAMRAEREGLEGEVHGLHMAYLQLQSTGDANEQLLRESQLTAEHLAAQAGDMATALEAQLAELTQERQSASAVLLSVSAELSQSQAMVAHKLGNIEADMLSLGGEEEDLSRRLESGRAEERRLREELERLWEQEREADAADNTRFAKGLAADEMAGVRQASEVVSALRPAGERLGEAELRSGNDFLAAIQALGSSIEAGVPVPGGEGGAGEAAAGGAGGRVRESIGQASEDINRARIAELVELQRRQERQPPGTGQGQGQGGAPAPVVAKAAPVVIRSARADSGEEDYSHSQSWQGGQGGQGVQGGGVRPACYRAGDEIESEIALIARRIRDRLMMPSSQQA
jgi:hypothetical protein